jgi:hypothetical protein
MLSGRRVDELRRVKKGRMGWRGIVAQGVRCVVVK